MSNWKNVASFPPLEHTVVKTCIIDGDGIRREALLQRKGSAWFSADMKFMMYYRPTHWKLVDTTS
jgi:hypothetical protein